MTVVAPGRDRLTLIPFPHVGEDPVGRYLVTDGTTDGTTDVTGCVEEQS